MPHQLRIALILIALASTVAGAQSDTTATAKGDTLRAGVSPPGTLRRGALRIDSPRSDSLRSDTLQSSSLRSDSLPSDSLAGDSLRRDILRSAPGGTDSARTDSMRTASRTDSLGADSLTASRDSTRRVAETRTSPAGRAAPAALGWTGDTPVQGTLASVAVKVDSATDAHDPAIWIDGIAAGEPLHFDADSGGSFRALVGIPVDTKDSLRLTIALVRTSGAADTVRQWLPVAPGEYRLEKLAVAPRYGGKPNAELAKRIAEEYRKAAAVSTQAHETAPLWSEPFLLPRESRVTSGFGSGREFNGKVQSRHTGLDLAGAVGAPVRAANRGIVRLVGDFYYAGNAVYIDHGGGLVTAYFHLNRASVAEGDTVARGEVIGEVGATGRVTGPHLHWVARYGSISLDPMSVLKALPPERRWAVELSP